MKQEQILKELQEISNQIQGLTNIPIEIDARIKQLELDLWKSNQ